MGYWSRKVRELAQDLGVIKPVGFTDKEYLTQAEAAAFCCLSVRQFRNVAPNVGLFPISFGGRLVYKKDDCTAAIESERWRQYS